MRRQEITWLSPAQRYRAASLHPTILAGGPLLLLSSISKNPDIVSKPKGLAQTFWCCSPYILTNDERRL